MYDTKSAVKSILDARAAALGKGSLDVTELDSRETAAHAIIKAVHGKDVGGLTSALADFHDLHAAKRDEHDTPKGPRNDNDD